MPTQISRQRKLPVHKDKLTTDNKLEFYDYMRNIFSRINNTFEAIYDALNFPQAIANFVKTDGQTASSADTWEDLTWDREDIIHERIRLNSSDDGIIFKSGGWFLVTYSISVENTKGSSLKDWVYTRATLDGEEIRQSQYFDYIERSSGAYITTGGIVFVMKARTDEELKIQFRVGDTDLEVSYTANAFDYNRSADLQIIQLESS